MLFISINDSFLFVHYSWTMIITTLCNQPLDSQHVILPLLSPFCTHTQWVSSLSSRSILVPSLSRNGILFLTLYWYVSRGFLISMTIHPFKEILPHKVDLSYRVLLKLFKSILIPYSSFVMTFHFWFIMLWVGNTALCSLFDPVFEPIFTNPICFVWVLWALITSALSCISSIILVKGILFYKLENDSGKHILTLVPFQIVSLGFPFLSAFFVFELYTSFLLMNSAI